MILYLNEAGSVLGKNGGRYVVKKENYVVREIPQEKLTAVVLFSGTHITSPCMMSLLEKDIPVTWLSSTGQFFGRVESTRRVNIERHRDQFRRAEDDGFCLGLARAFIYGKIRNSMVLLRRYNRHVHSNDVDEATKKMAYALTKLENAENMSSLNGVEGYASKVYFKALSCMVKKDFHFDNRNRQPPTDPFNSLLSFGYTLLVYEIFTAILNKGLHPYMGFLHRIRQGHPALASDLMEEWRPVLVDSLVMSLVQGNSLTWDDFQSDKNGGVYLRKDRARVFIQKFEERLNIEQKYLQSGGPCTFREAIAHQVGLLVKSIECQDYGIYKPILLR